MNKLQLTGAALAVALTSMVAFAADAGITNESTAPTTATPLVQCKGGDVCKEPNTCNSEGVAQLTKEDCEKAGGKAE